MEKVIQYLTYGNRIVWILFRMLAEDIQNFRLFQTKIGLSESGQFLGILCLCKIYSRVLVTWDYFVQPTLRLSKYLLPESTSYSLHWNSQSTCYFFELWKISFRNIFYSSDRMDILSRTGKDSDWKCLTRNSQRAC